MNYTMSELNKVCHQLSCKIFHRIEPTTGDRDYSIYKGALDVWGKVPGTDPKVPDFIRIMSQVLKEED